MSIKICVFLILGLLIIIHESESIKCYDCFHWIHGDGENCHKGINLREKDCYNQKFCYKESGKSMRGLRF